MFGDFSQAGSQIIIEDVPTILTTSKAQLLEDEIFDVLSSFGDFLGSNSPATYGNLYEKVIEPLRGPLFSNRKGAVGILKFLQDPIADIQGKDLLFEIPAPNARGTTSRIDVSVNNNRYEIKNCAACITPTTIKEQFIERDLFNASSVNDITKWKIYEQGYTQTQFISHLTSNKDAIENLGVERISQILDEDISDLTISQASDLLITFISDNYPIIFE